MKKRARWLLAVMLTVAMTLSCMPVASAAGSRTAKGNRTTNPWGINVDLSNVPGQVQATVANMIAQGMEPLEKETDAFLAEVVEEASGISFGAVKTSLGLELLQSTMGALDTSRFNLGEMGVFKPGTEEELNYGEVGEICVSGPSLMLGYDDEEKSVEAMWTHSDGLVWLHTADQGYINEDGVLYVLGRGDKYRYNGGALLEVVLENKVSDAGIKGLKDGFFVIIPDKEHEGYHAPYLYTVLEDGCTPGDIREAVDNALENFERPVDIIQLPARPFFHFKTNRIGLAGQLMGEN